MYGYGQSPQWMIIMSQPNKIYHLESLRGIAALSVAIFHFKIGSLLNNEFTNNAWIMVDFFFLLSGYVMALNYGSKLVSIRQALVFQWKRLVRLYPLHIAMLFIYLAIECAKYVFEAKVGAATTTPAFTTNNWLSFLQNIFLIQNLVNTHLTWNYPSWSISAEFYTYILFASLVLLMQKAGNLKLLLYILIIAFAAFKIYQSDMQSAQIGIYRCLLSFFIGVIVFQLETHLKAEVPPWFSLLVTVLTVTLVCYAGSFSNALLLLFPIVFSFLIICLNKTNEKSTLMRLLSNTWLVYLGTISYGIYMIHTMVWWFMKQACRFIFNVPSKVENEGIVVLNFDNVILATSVHLVGLTIIILLAKCSFDYLENPIKKKLQHRFS